jgi:hypothetical protein
VTDDYQPILPEHPDFIGVKIDTKNERYVSAAAAARDAGITQQQWTALLGQEARRVVDGHRTAKAAAASAPVPAPAPLAAPTRGADGKIPGYDKMSFSQKLAAAGHA